MTKNAYILTYLTEDGEAGECVMSGFTIADVDERFARLYPNVEVAQVCLVGEFVEEGE